MRAAVRDLTPPPSSASLHMKVLIITDEFPVNARFDFFIVFRFWSFQNVSMTVSCRDNNVYINTYLFNFLNRRISKICSIKSDGTGPARQVATMTLKLIL